MAEAADFALEPPFAQKWVLCPAKPACVAGRGARVLHNHVN